MYPWYEHGLKYLRHFETEARLNAMFLHLHASGQHSDIWRFIFQIFFSCLNQRELPEGPVNMKCGHKNWHSRSVFIVNGKLTCVSLAIQFFTVGYEGHWSPRELAYLRKNVYPSLDDGLMLQFFNFLNFARHAL